MGKLKRVRGISMKISPKLRDLILLQKALLEKELRGMGITKPISKVMASDILAKKIKRKLKK